MTSMEWDQLCVTCQQAVTLLPLSPLKEGDSVPPRPPLPQYYDSSERPHHVPPHQRLPPQGHRPEDRKAGSRNGAHSVRTAANPSCWIPPSVTAPSLPLHLKAHLEISLCSQLFLHSSTSRFKLSTPSWTHASSPILDVSILSLYSCNPCVIQPSMSLACGVTFRPTRLCTWVSLWDVLLWGWWCFVWVCMWVLSVFCLPPCVCVYVCVHAHSLSLFKAPEIPLVHCDTALHLLVL